MHFNANAYYEHFCAVIMDGMKKIEVNPAKISPNLA